MKESTSRKSVTLPVSMWREIAGYQERERIGTEAEAIRRLLQMALRSVGKKGKRDVG